MKLRTLSAALMTAGLGFIMQPTFAQGISDDVIRIGIISDMSGVYSDIDGPGGVEAIRMAIADAGGAINGKKIELLTADHQNKADIASSRAREWFDQQKIDMLIGGTNSATNLALARGTGSAVVKDGGKTWFFLTADYAFGQALERDTAAVVKSAGGEIKGQVRAPLSTADFSSFLLQAQASGAQILGLANAGGDTVNSIKAANEFGVTSTMKLAGLLIFINDIHSLGLKATQGMYLTDGWYWDQSDASRAWAARFEEKIKRKPSMLQAADYSAVTFYLNGIKATGTDDADTIMKWMKSTKINDFFAQGGYVREDGRMVHDMYLMKVKTPAESKGPWDYYNIVAKLPGEEVYAKLSESTCGFIKK